MVNYKIVPPVGAHLNRGNPLTRGLVDLWVFNEPGTDQGSPRTLTNGGEYATQNGGYWSASSHGRGRRYNGLTMDRWANSAERAIVGEVTVGVGFVSTLANPSNVQIVGKRNQAGGATGTEWGIFSDPTFGVYFNWQNGGSFQSVYDTGTLGAIPAGVYMTAVGTRPPAATSGKLYKNGVLIKETTGLSVPTSIGTPITIGGANNGSLLFDGIVHWIGLWNREMPASEVQRLHQNPYAMLAPVSPARFFTGMSASGSKAYYYAQTQGLR